MASGGIINDEMQGRGPFSRVSYRVKGFTSVHQAALRTVLADVRGIRVELRGGMLHVDREITESADAYQAFRREVDAAIRLVAPHAEVVNTFPGK